jgi:hypothetical protein
MRLPDIQQKIIILDNIDHYVPPKGTRDKRLFHKITDHINLISTERRCMFKECRLKKEQKLFVYEDIWGEVLAYWVGTFIDIGVSRAYLARIYCENSKKYVYGSLSEYVYSEKSHMFEIARDLLTAILPKYDFKTSKDHSLELVHKICKKFNVQNYEYDFTKMLLFDLLIGNGDRHQDNWALLWNLSGFKISPLYDNGSSFMFSNLDSNLNIEKLGKYLKNTVSKLKHQRTDKNFLKCNDIISVCLNLSSEACSDFMNDIDALKNYLPFIKSNMINLNKLINDSAVNVPRLTEKRINFICAYLEYRINAINLKIEELIKC